MNARHLLILPILALINGCSLIGLGLLNKPDPIEIRTKAEERVKLNLADPPPLKTRDIKWVIITRENAEHVFKELESKGVDVVIFGLTDEGYEQLALTMAELRNYVSTQRSIIIKYKDYYEPKKSETPASK